MKKWVADLINATVGNVKQFKLVRFDDGTTVKINTKPEMNLKLIKKELPNGLPAGEPPYDIV